MSRFFVGQRVRVVDGADSDICGKETSVTAVDVAGYERGRKFTDGVEVDVPLLGRPGFERYVLEPHDLEPILPEGQQPTAWSECLWRPDGSHKTEKVAEEGRAIALRALL